MKITIANLAATLQTLLTSTIFDLARLTGFFRRRRAYSLDRFVHTLLFGWVEEPRAPLESFAARLGVSPQALAQRFDGAAVAFARALLEAHLRKLFEAAPTRQRLLDRFSAIVVEDSTVITLPEDAAGDWPGCGNRTGHGKAAVKFDLRLELKTGRLLGLSMHAGRDHDAPLAAAAEDLPEGSLHLADLGYFDTGRWLGFGGGRHFISRANPQVMLLRRAGWQGLAELLAGLPAGADLLDRSAVINRGSLLPARLVALRCPEEVANRRKQKLRRTAKRKGKKVSAASLTLCEWTALITDVPASTLAAEEVWLAYRLRWQAELFFKRAKQFLALEFSHGRTGRRMLGELLLKLTGALIVNWAALLRGGPLARRGAWKRWRQAKHYLGLVAAGLAATGEIPREALRQMLRAMDRIAERPRCRTRPRSMDLLDDPGVTSHAA
jgi:hypothetical protein